mmetsp:Transcript_90019/g.160261  ORF Transcript_90019/g.160261 Transcript_90019/m.160261 type:complete len:197 (-) Transcript_90019:20-610(-)
MAPKAEAPKRTAAEILASFRKNIDRQIAGEPDPDAPKEPAGGQTFFLTTSSAVRKRKAESARQEQVKDNARIDRHALKDLEANGRGRKRTPEELKIDRDKKDEKRPFWAAKKQTKTKAKVTNVPPGLEYKYLKELFEKASGTILEGHLDQATKTAYLQFQKAEDAMTLYEDFHEGEISGYEIKVELLEDSQSVLQS